MVAPCCMLSAHNTLVALITITSSIMQKPIEHGDCHDPLTMAT